MANRYSTKRVTMVARADAAALTKGMVVKIKGTNRVILSNDPMLAIMKFEDGTRAIYEEIEEIVKPCSPVVEKPKRTPKRKTPVETPNEKKSRKKQEKECVVIRKCKPGTIAADPSTQASSSSTPTSSTPASSTPAPFLAAPSSPAPIPLKVTRYDKLVLA